MDNKFLLIFILFLILYSLYHPRPSIFHHSRINTKYDYNNFPKPNILYYPLYYLVNPLIIELFPGETLYIPKRWWHCVFSKEENIAINQWFHKNLSKEPFKFKNSKINFDIINKYFTVDKIKNSYFNDGIGIGQDNPNIYSYKRPMSPYKLDSNKIFFKGK